MTNKEMEEERERLRQLVIRVRDRNRKMLETLPSESATPAQHELARKHGTPKEFAQGLLEALGEISVEEANLAINSYLDEWSKAGHVTLLGRN